MLGGDPLKGCTTAAEKRDWLSAKWARCVETLGSAEVVLEGAKRALDRVVESTGVRQIRYAFQTQAHIAL